MRVIFNIIEQGLVNLSNILFMGGFWGRFLVGAVFGLLEASKTASKKPYP